MNWISMKNVGVPKEYASTITAERTTEEKAGVRLRGGRRSAPAESISPGATLLLLCCHSCLLGDPGNQLWVALPTLGSVASQGQVEIGHYPTKCITCQMKLLHHESYQDIADVRGGSKSWCKSSVKLKGSHI